MSILLRKVVADSLEVLTPQERVGLILEYQNLRETTNKDYSYEISQVQQKMPSDQRNEYAATALKVIITNRIILNLILFIKGKFYQEYNVFLLKIIDLLLSSKESEQGIILQIQILQTTYQYLLNCKVVADTISQQMNCENILFSIHEKLYQSTQNDIDDLLKATDQFLSSDQKIDCTPDSQFQNQIIETIDREVRNWIREI